MDTGQAPPRTAPDPHIALEEPPMTATVEPRAAATLDATLSADPARGSVLTPEMLARFRERAPRYDQENRFFDEDFEELRGAGYLTIAVPRELGGRGCTLSDVCREQRLLGYHAPA